MATTTAETQTAVADVRLDRVTKRFDDVVAVDGVTVEIPRGSFFALLGPSGCGKTTTLRMIGGFEEPDDGVIYLGDRPVTGLPPYKRDVNTVFQSYALFPHLTIFENVAFGLRRRNVARNQVAGRVQEILRLVDLAGTEQRKPRQLSGGMQQRVALARALVNNPQVLLLDEPLGALDLKLRKQMQLELKRIQHDMGITFVHVTHDQEEAMTMADVIAVMNRGRIEQLGPPDQLYERPRTSFVARFLGASNLLEGTVEDRDTIRLRSGAVVRGRGRAPAARHRRRRRSPAGEAPPRRGRRQPPLGHRQGALLRRRRHPVRRRDTRRAPDRLRPEHRAGLPQRRARDPRPRRLPTGIHVRRRAHRGGRTRMTDLTRLELLRRAALGGAALSIPGLLAACGGDDEQAAGTTTGAGAALASTLRFSNWQLYIDRDPKNKKKSPSLEQFTAKTGVKVDYVEDVNDNATYFGKIQGPLSQGRGIDRDIIVMTDNSRFPGLLVSKKWVEKLDKNRIPNISNLIDAQMSPPFDPDRTYSIPWLSGITGIATNVKASGGAVVTTMQQLLEDPKLKGKVTLLTEVADTMSPIMLENGDDPSNVTDASWNKAYDRVQKAVDSGQIRRFTGNDYVADLERGNIAAAVSWSGDVATGLAANKALRWNLPEQGSDIWTDNMFIPLEGSVPTASEYMNFVLDPKIAAMIAVGAGYISPVKGVKDEAVKLDPESANNPLIFPDDEILSNVVQFDSAALNNQTYIEQWQQLLGA